MATRGAKPQPAHLRVIQGTHRNSRHGPIEDVLAPPGEGQTISLKRPATLKGRAAKAWDLFITPAHWIDIHRLPAAIIFCQLWAEYEEGPKQFGATKHGQMRAYMSELGLTDERKRSTDAPRSEDPAARFLR